jgi:uncharacterized protein
MACKFKTFRNILFILLCWFYPAALPAVTPPLPAQPSQYVVDLAGVMDAGAQARLNGMLRDLEEKTTAQVVVLTLNSLEGEPIESFSHQTAVKWGIGQKGKDNGVLITVAVKDRKYRIEVGYGLESTLPDSLVGSIGRQYLVPHFKKGDFAGGIVAAVEEITNKIAGGTGGEATPGKAAFQEKEWDRSDTIAFIMIILFVIAVPIILLWIISKKVKKRGMRDDGGGFWGGGWSSGGGGSDFGGSGFSGGGGDFGGGGASGDW